VSRLAEGLVRQGIDTRVLTTNAGLPQLPPQQLGRPLLSNGVMVTYFPVDRPKGPIHSKALLAALPAALEGVDLLHISAIWQPLGIPVQRAALARGIPVLASLRGALGPYSLRQGWWKKLPWYLWRERPLLQRAAGLHVTTRQEERELAGLGLGSPRFLLPNPLDLQTLRPDPALGLRWRAQRGLDATTPLLLVCGRHHHKKGLDLLPAAMAPLANRPWTLLLVGADVDGSGARLRAHFGRAGLGDRLHWIDTLPAEELAGVYNAADLLLLPSRHENFGNVVVEALACGTAVLMRMYNRLVEYRLPAGETNFERIFSVPGMGSLIIDAISQRDRELILANTFMIACVNLVALLIADILYAVADPRVSYE
jgi:glycosyltransferase involved in cell wall biosynthesis